MKLSILTPIYNEEDYISRYLDSLINLNYPKSSYEVVFVDDASTDRSAEIIKEFHSQNPQIPLKYYKNKKNKGILFTLNEAIKYSNYEFIVIIGAHSIIDANILSAFSEIYKDTKSNVIMGNSLFESDNNISIIQNAIVRRLYGKNKVSDNFTDYYINEENFEENPKGTSPLFIKKQTYIDNAPTETGKKVSDDIKLFKNIIESEGKFLRTSKAKCIYLSRNSILNEIIHIHERGPKFIDYYLHKGTRFFKYIVLLIALSIIAPFLILLIYYLGGFKLVLVLKLIFLVLLFLVPLILFARKTKEIIPMLIFPILLISFVVGVYKGLLIRSYKYISVNFKRA